MTYTMGSLFAGIGGFDLGFERAGFKTSWQVEIDPYCQKVLAKNFPEAERFGDIRECGSHNLKPVDVICGGFPCQDISNAGKRAGIEGERSGLWSEYARIIGELRPSFVLVENVAALVAGGMGRVLGDLAVMRYDAEWQVYGADSLGASQHRKRIWILAYTDDQGLEGTIWAGQQNSSREERTAAYSKPLRPTGGFWPPGPREVIHIPRMADGPTNRMDRLRGLGNAVVPQIPEMIARRIKQALESPHGS